MNIVTSVEAVRGCGYRKTGAGGVGIYLMGQGVFEPCERLPFPLHVCPTCGEGVKPSRGWTWTDPRELFDPAAEPRCTADDFSGFPHAHYLCWACSPREERAGLLWIGEAHYATAREFLEEAATMGISRKVSALPRGFEPGRTVVYLAHRKAAQGEDDDGEPVAVPAVFTVFKPERVDLVVDTTDPAELPPRALHLAERLGDRGRLVKVVRGDDPGELFE